MFIRFMPFVAYLFDTHQCYLHQLSDIVTSPFWAGKSPSSTVRWQKVRLSWGLYDYKMIRLNYYMIIWHPSSIIRWLNMIILWLWYDYDDFLGISSHDLMPPIRPFPAPFPRSPAGVPATTTSTWIRRTWTVNSSTPCWKSLEQATAEVVELWGWGLDLVYIYDISVCVWVSLRINHWNWWSMVEFFGWSQTRELLQSKGCPFRGLWFSRWTLGQSL